MHDIVISGDAIPEGGTIPTFTGGVAIEDERIVAAGGSRGPAPRLIEDGLSDDGLSDDGLSEAGAHLRRAGR